MKIYVFIYSLLIKNQVLFVLYLGLLDKLSSIECSCYFIPR